MRTIAFLVLTAAAAFLPAREATAQRQYYETTYTYSPMYQYHYVRYYYKPVVTVSEYSYHYCIYYPSQPRYIYYYNPTRQVYWGRYEIGSKGEERYSILAEKDRKKELKNIPEAAFPKPAAMPSIPEAEDKIAVEPPPENVPKPEQKK